jgi:hypothetical protein
MRVAMQFALRVGAAVLEEVCSEGGEKATKALQELQEGDAFLQRKSDASDHSSSTLGSSADGGDSVAAASAGSSVTTVRDIMASDATMIAISYHDTDEYARAKRYITVIGRTLAMSEYGGCPFITSFDDATHTITGRDHDEIPPGAGIAEFQAQMQTFKAQQHGNTLGM